MTIKHLVLSGGSWKGLYMAGAIDSLLDEKYFEKDSIETLWVTSVGGIISILLCLKINWKDIIEYFINVPIKVFEHRDLNDYMNAYKNCGVLNKTFFTDLLNSLFKTNNLDINTITLKEFNDFSGKEINFFTTKYERLEVVIFNYKTHPDLKLLDVLYASCCFPFGFEPARINDEIYIDGGVTVHYPSSYALKEKKNEEILGIYIKTMGVFDSNFSNMLNFGINLIYKVIFERQKTLNLLNNEVVITCESINDSDGLKKLINNKEKRRNKIDEGKKYVYLFLKYSNNSV